MKMTPKDIYLDAATHALAGFQLVEASLKDYIAEHADAVRKLVKGKLCYKFDRENVNDAALGKLCTIFSKYCDNEKLTIRIRSLQKTRDNLAHRALAVQFDREMSANEYLKAATNYESTAREIGDILAELNRERIMLSQRVQGKQSHEV